MNRTFTLAPLSLVAVLGCSSAGKGPTMAASGGQTSYAVGYAEEVTSATKAINDAQTKEKQLTAGFAAHVDELKKPDWEKVETIISDSDEAGKSADFAEAQGDALAVKSFWDAEKNEIAGRVNGNAQHTLKQAGCTADTAGPISYAMNEAVTKQLQKKLRSKNEAFVVIERYKTSLGPQNTASLEKLADEVAEASYDVHVLMVLQRNRLQRLVADRDDVKKTIDRFVQEEQAFQAEPGRTEPEKKASQDRVTAANKSKADLDKAAQEADAVAKQMDKSIEAATKDYEKALSDLKAKVAEKKRAEPPPPPPRRPPPRQAPPALSRWKWRPFGLGSEHHAAWHGRDFPWNRPDPPRNPRSEAHRSRLLVGGDRPRSGRRVEGRHLDLRARPRLTDHRR